MGGVRRMGANNINLVPLLLTKPKERKPPSPLELLLTDSSSKEEEKEMREEERHQEVMGVLGNIFAKTPFSSHPGGTGI